MPLSSYYLKKNSDYKLISKHGRTVKGFAFVALICNKSRLNNASFTENKPAFGITASKKLGNAVTRNLLKRRLKHIIRELPQTDKLNDLAINFCYRKAAANLSFAQLRKETTKIIKKL